MYTETITQKTRQLKILIYTDKSTIRGQISTRLPYAETLEAYLHIHIFLDAVVALGHCENNKTSELKLVPFDRSRPRDTERITKSF